VPINLGVATAQLKPATLNDIVEVVVVVPATVVEVVVLAFDVFAKKLTRNTDMSLISNGCRF